MFKYKVTTTPKVDLPTGKQNILRNDDEVLSGFIDGMKASDIEERFARALSKDKRILGRQFRYPVISPRNMLGQLEVDFLINATSGIYPVQVDGEYAHKNISKRQDDYRKDVLVNNFLKKYNAFPVIRIPGRELITQQLADLKLREIIR